MKFPWFRPHVVALAVPFFTVFLLLASPVARCAEEAVTAADYSQPWQITSYVQAAGLSQQRIFDVAFTADDDAWLATDAGLCRFDGIAWTRFGTRDGLPPSLLRALCVDKTDALWIGSDAGAGVWDVHRHTYDMRGLEVKLANRNVREIDQDPDGTLWFCCDQWPEITEQPGGLTSVNPRTGGWSISRQTNGLPMDYVIGYFRDSTGRQFAQTPHGWVQKQGDGWRPPVDPGYKAEECVLCMAEGRDGTVFAQGESTLLTLSHGRWQRHPQSQSRAVCSTHDGEVVAVECEPGRGRLWFSLWNGHQFVRASAPVPFPTNGRIYHLREAPDGALWCVGTSTVVRWAFRAGHWTLYPRLPAPVGTDALGRTWFAGGSNMVIQAGGQFQTLAPGRLMGWDATGAALVWDQAQDALTVSAPETPERRTLIETGCEAINSVVPDNQGHFWILGRDPAKNGRVLYYADGQTQTITAPEFTGQELTFGTLDGPDRLLAIARPRSNNLYSVAEVTLNKVSWLPLDPAPPLTYASVQVAAGHRWLFGYSGLYEQPTGEAKNWQPITAFPHGGFAAPLASEGELLVTFSGGGAARAGCALYCSNRWTWTSGEFVQPTFGPDKKTIYLPGRNGVFIRRQVGTLDFDYLQVPGDALVGVAVAGAGGSLWLGTEDGTLLYRPGKSAPHTIVTVPTAEIRRRAPLPIQIRGQTPFEPVKDPAGFRYSWRVDQGEWSPLGPWPGDSLKLPPLKSGAHVLQMRSRDFDGNLERMPAMVPFSILPDPLQGQPWFLLVASLLGLLLCWLSWLSFVHIRQIGATNSELNREVAVRRETEAALQRAHDELEQQVVERTAQLTHSNQQLSRQISERKTMEINQRKLEEQLHQSQKMEAIGTLAGGIAHDFNNILAIIIPYADLAMEELPDRPELQEYLREVLKAANRAKTLVQQILTFSRRGPQQREMCELQSIVKEAIILLRFVLPSTIRMEQRILQTHPVLADPTQIHQVLMNLCINAQHAMEGRQGRLDIDLDEMAVDAALCERHPELHPGLYVRIVVRDTGCGIAPEHLNRIFDPFFTTKEVGKGTGLGLAVVEGIVRHHAGTVLVRSEVGKGSEFQVLLPAQTYPVPEANPPAAPKPPVNGEHILIVDDETGIISALKRVLMRAGYRVSAHADSRTALEDFQGRPGEFDLVISDLTMPGLNGLELSGELGKVRPELPVIIATGFAGSLITPEMLAEHPNIRHTVEKPFSPESIVRLVSKLLEPAPPK